MFVILKLVVGKWRIRVANPPLNWADFVWCSKPGSYKLVLEAGKYCFCVAECSGSFVRSCGTVGTTECKTSGMIDQAGYH